MNDHLLYVHTRNFTSQRFISFMWNWRCTCKIFLLRTHSARSIIHPRTTFTLSFTKTWSNIHPPTLLHKFMPNIFRAFFLRHVIRQRPVIKSSLHPSHPHELIYNFLLEKLFPNTISCSAHICRNLSPISILVLLTFQLSPGSLLYLLWCSDPPTISHIKNLFNSTTHFKSATTTYSVTVRVPPTLNTRYSFNSSSNISSPEGRCVCILPEPSSLPQSEHTQKKFFSTTFYLFRLSLRNLWIAKIKSNIF